MKGKTIWDLILAIIGVIIPILSFWWGAEMLFIILYCLIVGPLSIYLITHFAKKEEEKEKRFEKIEEKRAKIKEEEYRPLIAVNLLSDDECMDNFVVGDNTQHSKLVIENLDSAKKALDVHIKIKKNKKTFFNGKIEEIAPRECVKLTCHKQFPEPGIYAVYIKFKSELKDNYRSKVLIRCVEEPWKHWCIITQMNLWIKRNKKWEKIEEKRNAM